MIAPCVVCELSLGQNLLVCWLKEWRATIVARLSSRLWSPWQIAPTSTSLLLSVLWMHNSYSISLHLRGLSY
ncbi:hypothetical protein EXIGLDRAFT_384124 [Exidia glandulosa HHB12029]|uniref:Uncharacterized protein n=1 Tax=Exidia glandulosa HHB12029 TaxID=1314781 RepID=A0A165L455_EXIGL|nr:hypothetical protein EXIGLDRAFT_384124 [Exidia glandulosa HHB12029]